MYKKVYVNFTNEVVEAVSSYYFIDYKTDFTTRNIPNSNNWSDLSGTDLSFEAEEGCIYKITFSFELLNNKQWTRTLIRVVLDGEEIEFGPSDRFLYSSAYFSNTYSETYYYLTDELVSGTKELKAQARNANTGSALSIYKTIISVEKVNIA